MGKTLTVLPVSRPSQLPPPLPREAGDISPARVCRMVFDELCVLANGDVVCSCGDPAGKRVYGNVYRDRLTDLYNRPLYREIRRWQLASRPDSYCPVVGTRCGGRVSAASGLDGETGRVVRMLQLEPISYCNLRCPACPATRIAEASPDYAEDRLNRLPLEVMLDVVDQLPGLEKLLFYNFGEPFLHSEAVAFLREVRRQRPDVTLHTSTNGHALSDGRIAAIAGEALVDRIVFSIDGAFETSYRRYRVGGRLEDALARLAAFVCATRAAGTQDRVEVIWQYILFEWNDTQDELGEARRLADEIGVPIRWVTTHTAGASRRFRYGSPELARLVAGDDYATMTCDLRMAELWSAGGVAAGRYRAGIRSPVEACRGGMGQRLFFPVHLTNESGKPWCNPSGREFRLGIRLRPTGDGSFHELQGIPLPKGEIAPGERILRFVDIVLPNTVGPWELFVDVVEEGVCWFSDRGSQALGISVVVELGPAPVWDPAPVVEFAYRRLLRKPADAEGRRWWTQRLGDGLTLELFLAEFGRGSSERDAIDREELGALLRAAV